MVPEETRAVFVTNFYLCVCNRMAILVSKMCVIKWREQRASCHNNIDMKPEQKKRAQSAAKKDR